MIRMNAGTAVSILNLDDRIAQLQLTQGALNVRVLRLASGQVFEVDTPNLAFTLRQPGAYRIEVEPDGSATTIIVRKGQGEVYGEDAAYVIDSRQPYRFVGTGLREYQYVDAPRLDEFDNWSSDRDRSYDGSASARYVSPDVIGYQDLDANGTWRADATYGNVWFPNRVASGWAPYSDGHWAWVDPWGWTWVDDAPWGFAVSHYGRWTNLAGTWGWVPGPVRTQAYYAPALVAFVGGSNFQLAISGGNVGGIAWFPLGPREVYRPSYAVSRGYFENVNRSNTVINTTVINNYYNNTSVTNVVYANRQVPGAVVAVPTTAFVQSQPVSRAAVKVSREMVANAPVAVVAPVAPTEKSVRGAAAQGEKPPARAFERPVVARTAPPATPVGFAAQQQQLAAKPGKPLDDAARKEMRPTAAAPAPVVKVVAPAQVAQPTVRPPPAAPAAKRDEAGGKTNGRNDPRTRRAAAAATATRGPGSACAAASSSAGTNDAAAGATRKGRAAWQGGPARTTGRAAATTTATRGTGSACAAASSSAGTNDAAAGATRKDRTTWQGGPARTTGRAAAATTATRGPGSACAAASSSAGTNDAAAGATRKDRTTWQGGPARTTGRAAAATTATRGPGSACAGPQRSAPPAMAAPPPPQAAPPAPAARQAEPRPPVAAPPPQPQPAPQAQPRGQEPKPAAAKPDDKKKDSDEQKREEEGRKPKG